MIGILAGLFGFILEGERHSDGHVHEHTGSSDDLFVISLECDLAFQDVEALHFTTVNVRRRPPPAGSMASHVA